ncbi:MAG: type IV pilus secretin PilQ [Proteobacteria bacterium]|nr:type IV pilus secretin PilQ [Pseudomonadota bacterium]
MKRASKLTRRLTLLSAAFCLCSSIAWEAVPPRTDNSVTSLNYVQEAARTLIEIGVSADPTFSVYTLKNPSRVVVEILDCDESFKIDPVLVRNGIIHSAAISVSQSDDYRVCRIIMSLDQEADYTVDSTSKRIVLAVEGAPVKGDAAMAVAYEEMKRSRDEALAAAQRAVAKEQAAAAAAQSQAQAALEREKAALLKLEEAYASAQTRVDEALARERKAQNQRQAADGTTREQVAAALTSAQSELQMAQSNMAALEQARHDATLRAQRAEQERDQAQAQAKAALRREQQAIAGMQKAQAEAQALAQTGDQARQTAAENATLLAALEAQRLQAQALADRAERAHLEAERLVAETRHTETTRLAEAEKKLNAAVRRADKAQADQQTLEDKMHGMDAQHKATLAAEWHRTNDEIAAARTELARLQSERDAALKRSQEAETDVQHALRTAQTQRQQTETQLAALMQELAQTKTRAATAEAQQSTSEAELAQLRNDYAAALSRAQKVEENYSSLSAENAALQSELMTKAHLVETQNAAATAELKGLRAAYEAAEAQKATTTAELERLRHAAEAQNLARTAELERLRHAYETAEAQKSTTAAELTKLRHAYEVAEAQKSTTAAELTRLRDAAEAQNLARTAELERLRAAYDAAEAQKSTTAAELARLRDAAEAQNLARATELERLRAAYENAEAQKSTTTAELERLRAAYENAEAQKSTAAAELAKLRMAYETAETQKSTTATELARLRENADAQNSATTAELERLRAAHENVLTRAQTAEQNNASLNAENAALQAKLSAQSQEMVRLNEEINKGSTARRQLKTLESESASQAALSEAAIAERDARIAELREQVRQGRHARAQLESLKSENADLRARADGLAVAAATPPSVAAAAPPVTATAPPAAAALPPIDFTAENMASRESMTSRVATTAPLDLNIGHTSVKDIQFKDTGDTMQVVVKLSSPAARVESRAIDAQRTLLRIPGASLPEGFNKKFDTSAFQHGVRFIDSTQVDGNLELIAQSVTKTIESIDQVGDTVIWSFKKVPSNYANFTASVDRRQNAMVSASEPDSNELASTFGRRNTLRDTPFAKRKITLDIRDADINDLLRLLSDEINVSIVVSPEVKGQVTLSLKSVPLDQALDIILRMNDLAMKFEGNIIWVAKAATFRAEEERLLKAAEVRERLEPLEVRLIPVNYALADQLKDNVASLLSSRGTVNIDARTNTLILKDVPANLDAAEILVDNLDTQTPQILIEARIVETQANFTKELGVQWGGDGIASAATGNATGIVFPSTIGVAGGSTSDLNSGTAASPNFAVNLPASVGTGSGGAIGMTFGSIGGALNLNVRLSALEEKGFLKIVSAPRIMTLDNVRASIEQGTSIPISVVSAAGVQTVFYDAKLNLEVTPHVTRDGNVYLKIDISKNEPDFGNTGASGDPSIIRKEAHTELLIPDGDTTVIGGIYTRNTSQSMSSVPFFGSIPFLGYLFRSTSETDNRTELLIFITPRIINRDASIAASGPGSFIPPEERTEERRKK